MLWYIFMKSDSAKKKKKIHIHHYKWCPIAKNQVSIYMTVEPGQPYPLKIDTINSDLLNSLLNI